MMKIIRRTDPMIPADSIVVVISHLHQMPLAAFQIFSCRGGYEARGMSSCYCQLAICIEDGLAETGDVQVGQSLRFYLD